MSDSNSGGLSISELITAVATTATAPIGWFAYRYSLRSAAPIVESDEPEWSKNGNIIWRITVRNRSATAHRFLNVHITKPKKARISMPDSKLGPAQILDLSWLTLWPIGTVSTLLIEHPADQTTLEILLEPPSGWLGGALRIDLTIADKSSRPRQRRFVISKLIHATPSKTTPTSSNRATESFVHLRFPCVSFRCAPLHRAIVGMRF